MKNISTILLLSKDHDVIMPVIRALGSVLPGHITLSIVSTAHRFCFPKFSRYIHHNYRLDLNRKDDLTGQLLELVENPQATILLPLDEYFVRLLSVKKDQLSMKFHLPPLPLPQIFDSLVNKSSLNKLLIQQQLPAPKTYELNNEAVQQIDADLYPLILKPVRGSSGRGIKAFKNKTSLIEYLQGLEADDYVLQEFLPGKDVDCSLFAIDGEIKALTVQKGLESRGFNFSTAIRFEQNKTVCDITKKLIKHTKYSGVAHLDFRLDSRDGQPKLIDFNARFWLSLLGSKAAGVNFAYLYCLAALNTPFKQPDFLEVNYMMGKSAFNYYYLKAFKKKMNLPVLRTLT